MGGLLPADAGMKESEGSLLNSARDRLFLKFFRRFSGYVAERNNCSFNQHDGLGRFLASTLRNMFFIFLRQQ